MAKYDDVKWHAGGDFPADLPPEKAATHIGMFLGWAVERRLAGEMLESEFPDRLAAFRERRATGARLVLECTDGKLTDDDLNEEGNAFAADYYEGGDYFDDYADVLGDQAHTLYHVEDTWRNYELMRERLDRRLGEWRAQRRRG